VLVNYNTTSGVKHFLIFFARLQAKSSHLALEWGIPTDAGDEEPDFRVRGNRLRGEGSYRRVVCLRPSQTSVHFKAELVLDPRGTVVECNSPLLQAPDEIGRDACITELL
jgi:hypothetical protein